MHHESTFYALLTLKCVIFMHSKRANALKKPNMQKIAIFYTFMLFLKLFASINSLVMFLKLFAIFNTFLP